MSDSVRPHRRQPTRLPRPWDSPGKNTGVGCHFLLQCMKVKSESEVTQLCPTLSDPMDCSPPGSSVHGIFQARVLEWVAIAFSEEQHTTSEMSLNGEIKFISTLAIGVWIFHIGIIVHHLENNEPKLLLMQLCILDAPVALHTTPIANQTWN